MCLNVIGCVLDVSGHNWMCFRCDWTCLEVTGHVLDVTRHVWR